MRKHVPCRAVCRLILIVFAAGGISLGTGCRIREYMIPTIVRGELAKIAKQQPHRALCVAHVTRGEATQEVSFTVDFGPPDRLRYDIIQHASAPAAVLCVSTESFLFYDSSSRRAEIFTHLPPYSKKTFKEFRQFALRQTLEQNRVSVETDDGEMGREYWQLRTEPKAHSLWPHRSLSYILKQTKNNVRAVELDTDGNIVNEFRTLSRENQEPFPAGHFELSPPEDCLVSRYDLDTLESFPENPGTLPPGVPSEHEGFPLARQKQTLQWRLFDYTQRQMVLFYLERQSTDFPLLKDPSSREIRLPGGIGYISYAGTYTMCRWRTGGWDRLVFTNLGPEIALSYARRVCEAELPSASPVDAPADGGEREKEKAGVESGS